MVTSSPSKLLEYFSIFVFFACIFTTSLVEAQQSGCTERNGINGIVECDVSFGLRQPLTQSGKSWNPIQMSSIGMNIDSELNEFARTWCQITEGYSRIRNISVYTEGSPADFQLVNGNGRSYTYIGGTFPIQQPSATVFYLGLSNSKPDEHLGEVIAHEFAHSALKIFDEYRGEFMVPTTSTVCSEPLLTDDPRATIMANHRSYDRFSFASDYLSISSLIPGILSYIPRTAQYRCYEKSAWETLVQPQGDDLVKMRFENDPPRTEHFKGRNIPPDNADIHTCSDPKITWIDRDPIVILLIDDSGSMTGPPLLMAMAAAKQTVTLLAAEQTANVAIIGFDDSARTAIGLTPIGAQVPNTETNEVMINAAINSLIAGGGTNFQNPLNEAAGILRGVGDLSNKQLLVVLLSDGLAPAPNTSYFKTNGIPIYTVGIGTAVAADTLSRIAAATNGRYMAGTAGDLSGFFSQAVRDASIVQNNQLVMSSRQILTGTEMELTAMLSELAESASFIVRWDDAGVLDSFTLKRPDGFVIDSIYAASTSAVSYVEGTTQAIYSISSPLSGSWTAVIRGTGNFEYEVAVSSVITAGINAGTVFLPQLTTADTTVVYPAPILISAYIIGIEPVVDADVRAEITMPDDSTVTITLADGGEASDGIAGDGSYSGVLGDYSQDGIYDIEVIASNLNGRAMFDSREILDGGDSEPIPAPAFQRVVYTQVEVDGTAEKKQSAIVVQFSS